MLVGENFGEFMTEIIGEKKLANSETFLFTAHKQPRGCVNSDELATSAFSFVIESVIRGYHVYMVVW